ncbi:FAD-binding oxidoreductase [soil metagenome]
MPLLSSEVLTRLEAALGPDVISRDAADLAEYGRDWTRVLAPAASAIAFPRSTEQVSKLLAFCNAENVAVVPSGGRTGLAGGALAANGEVVLSLARMRRMDAVDRLGDTVRVQAGAVTEAVHEHCAPLGLTWPVDFASKGSSTVGGNIATNAGGVKVIRYGLTRQWVLGLEVVLASGEVLEIGGALEKNNTGLDLRQLFIGSEGTLGVVTEATLKLARLPGPTTVMLLGVTDVAAVLALFREARSGPFTLSAYEFFSQRCLDRLLAHRKLRPPLDEPCPYYVLIEAEAPAEIVEPWVARVFESGLAKDGTIAQHGSQARDLWALREGISESLSATGLPHKNDVALPIARLDAFCSELDGVFASRYPDWEICLFGHVGDGNLHINVMKPDQLDRAEFFAKTKEADRELFALVQRHHGSISAEHGIGLLKKPYLS